MIEAIRYNLAHLTDFGGRQGRRRFWLWVLAVAVLNMLVSLGLSLSLTASAMSEAMEVARGGDSAAVEAAVLQQMLPQMPLMVWTSIALSAANVVLLGAAFVRRLHDAGFTGWIALLPLLAVAANAVLALEQLELVEAMMRGGAVIEPQGAAWKGLLGWLPLLLIAGFGALRSQPQANRWGEPPASA